MDKVVESFITTCDEMLIAEESFDMKNIWKTLGNALKELWIKFKNAVIKKFNDIKEKIRNHQSRGDLKNTIESNKYKIDALEKELALTKSNAEYTRKESVDQQKTDERYKEDYRAKIEKLQNEITKLKLSKENNTSDDKLELYQKFIVEVEHIVDIINIFIRWIMENDEKYANLSSKFPNIDMPQMRELRDFDLTANGYGNISILANKNNMEKSFDVIAKIKEQLDPKTMSSNELTRVISKLTENFRAMEQVNSHLMTNIDRMNTEDIRTDKDDKSMILMKNTLQSNISNFKYIETLYLRIISML